MIKNIICLILTVWINSICFSQSKLDKLPKECYVDKIKLNTKGKEFKDTVIMVRNYVIKDDSKRVICNKISTDRGNDQLIFESRYIKNYLTYQNKMNKFSIVNYNLDNQNKIIVSYFLCDRESKETVEMVRFKLAGNKIIGINILPGIIDNFVPVDEFDKNNENGFLIQNP